MSLVPAQRLNTASWPTLLLPSLGFAPCSVIFNSLWLVLNSGATTLVPSLWLLILSSTLELVMSRWTITTFVKRLFVKSWRSATFPPKIRLPIFSLKASPLIVFSCWLTSCLFVAALSACGGVKENLSPSPTLRLSHDYLL